ncbi:hypothetical protein CPLU01_08819 [Colletotrichum plurivorum]|uniref:Nephrocystin 3-like N-terminal domain-containing protein n=1 Tax=Colletotrichum plurivorum TaxID=2175906 RepID=A0A8H6KAQ5_9PEZI|nr:hypothetical protein CPLU01_08819 [Colletotrichum plurivorum]
MEPIGAVGLAASILQFIEFTAKLFKEANEICDSIDGLTVKNNDLEMVTKHIHKFNIKICDEIPSNEAGDAVKSLGAECINISRELLEALDQVRAIRNSTKWANFVKALRAVWAKERIQDLRDRLDHYRETMHTLMLASLLNQGETLAGEVSNLRTESTNAIESLRVDLLQAIQTQKASESRDPDQDEFISRCLRSLAAEESKGQRQRRLVAQLSFASGYEREHRIEEAYAETIRWIWDDPKIRAGCPAWSDFPSWLEGGRCKLYWITGKPGSGKSTLMKYILYDSGCDQLLKRWAGDLPLVLPGSDSSPWGLGELEQAIKTLARSAAGNFKLLVFVDGLDEFGGEHDVLIRLCQTIFSFDNVKACLSSRPWVIFEEAFRQEPRLKLEDFTFDDITGYITDKFAQNSGYKALQKQDLKLPSNLIQNIAKRSRGVFLWIRLVVKSMLDGLSNRDQVADLQRRLDELPSDLEKLYQKMFYGIEPCYTGRRSRLFLMLSSIGLSLGKTSELRPVCRTVKDVLQSAEIDDAIARESLDFDPHAALLSSVVQMTKNLQTDWYWHYPNCSSNGILHQFTHCALFHASRISPQPASGHEAILLQELEKTITHHQHAGLGYSDDPIGLDTFLYYRLKSYFLFKIKGRDFMFFG